MTKITDEAVETLRAVPYLAKVPESELHWLAARCVWRTTSREGQLFQEGETATALLVIVEGRIKLTRVSRAGREQVLHVEGAGATLGEVPVFDGAGYLATAVALTDVRVLAVAREALFATCERHPSVALAIVAGLAKRLRTFSALIGRLALQDVTARVAQLLLEESAAVGPRESVDIGSREAVAVRLGTVRELVSRSLTRLAAAGLIERAGRRLRVVDRKGLQSLAEE